MGTLNDLQVTAAASADREILPSDGDGLYLRVRLTGRSWIFRYRIDGKQVKLALGRYPALPTSPPLSRWLLRRRPDLIAAERRLAPPNARIGVAVAE